MSSIMHTSYTVIGIKLDFFFLQPVGKDLFNNDLIV